MIPEQTETLRLLFVYQLEKNLIKGRDPNGYTE